MNARMKASNKLKCPQCKFKTMSGYYLKRHIRVFHEEKNDVAKMGSVKIPILKRQMRSANKGTTFSCPRCDLKAARKSSLLLHMKAVHQNEKEFFCNQCDFKTAYKNSLREHVKAVHNGIKKHSCEMCGFQTAYKQMLQEHVKAIHDTRKDLSCNQCPYMTSRKNSLQRHFKMVHDKIRDKKCSQCNFETSLANALKKHVENIHEKRKDFACKRCDLRTSSNAILKQHVKAKHDKIHDICCQHCSYKTYSKYTLLRHMRAIHLKVKDIACELCDYKTSLRQNLKNHARTVHDTLNYSVTCINCNYKTKTESLLRKHIKSVHVKIEDEMCTQCDFQESNPSRVSRQLKRCSVKTDIKIGMDLKECYVKLAPLDPDLLIESFTPSEEIVKVEPKDSGPIPEGVVNNIKEAAFKDVKSKIGEAVALYLFDQWWAMEEEKFKKTTEELMTSASLFVKSKAKLLS